MESAKNKPAIGFLSVIEHPQHGLFGGYLVLNLAGRPLEFHCTAPIKPNRAQQILYGPTLDAYLYGEQIGATLLGHAKTGALAVCTDCEPVLALRDLVELPVALVMPAETFQLAPSASADASRAYLRADAPHSHHPRLIGFELGRNRLAIGKQRDDDRKQLCEQLGEAAASLDLWEPFTRIREAIEEAQQAAR